MKEGASSMIHYFSQSDGEYWMIRALENIVDDTLRKSCIEDSFVTAGLTLKNLPSILCSIPPVLQRSRLLSLSTKQRLILSSSLFLSVGS
jgi:hypothetical protein